MVVDEDSSFVTGDSPHVITAPTTLGRNANRGYIRVDGTGDIKVEIAHKGTSYLTQFTLKNADSFDLTGLDVATIRLTWVSDSGYRLVAW